MRRALAFLASALLAGCSLDELTGGADRFDPTDLTYRLLPSGDPEVPAGILLEWTPPTSSRVVSFDVHGRSATRAAWMLRATTTSPSFHDSGVPQLEYYVSSHDENGEELGRSEVVFVDERNRLPAPRELRSITLDRAIHLSWPTNAYDTRPNDFDHYRVYSSILEVAAGRCAARWSFEGSTVSHNFIAGGLTNGIARCFAVSAVSRDGHESLWSPVRGDTPRPEARNVIVDAYEVRPATSGFLFHDVTARRFGVVGDGQRATMDFRVERRADGSLWFRPMRDDVRVMVYGDRPIVDLTTIDRAPSATFQPGSVEAVSGYGYVFSVKQADGTHVAAVHVDYVARDYVVLDWSYQTAPGSPELLRADR